jgi:L,D-transpeptidase ErfK/SrfK
VIGQVRTYRIRKGDTLLDVARYFDLGWNEIIDANPYIDPWVPPAGSTILLPTEWVPALLLVRGRRREHPGDAALLLFPLEGGSGDDVVYTYPVGLGRTTGGRRPVSSRSAARR